jgi:hypothetical protein
MKAVQPIAPRAQLVADVVIGFAARLVLALTTAYRGSDADVLAAWGRTMRDHPLGTFYAEAPTPDHLPGDLWILKAIQVGFTSLGGHDFQSGAFEFLTNVVPMVADVVVGILLFRIVLLWSTEEAAARAARWYLLNPAVIVLAGAWGQWDSVSIAAFLCGVLLLLHPGPMQIGAVPMLVWAVLIKPQLVVPSVLVLLWVVAQAGSSRGDPTAARRRRVGAAAAGSLVAGGLTAVALLAPFSVGLAWTPGGGSSLATRVHYAADLHRFTTMGAANVWMVMDRRVIGPADDVARWGPLSAATVGLMLLVAAWCLVGAISWRGFDRTRQLECAVWTAGTATFAACLTLTRVHERYYFPALVLVLVWAAVRGFDRAAVALFWSFSALFTVDLVLPMGWTGHDHQFLHRPATLAVIGLLHVVLFVVLLAVPLHARASAIRAGAPSAASGARRRGPG